MTRQCVSPIRAGRGTLGRHLSTGEKSVKNRIALSAAVVAGLLSLAACAPDPIGSDSASPSPSASAGASNVIPATDVDKALGAVTWTDGADGAAPTIAFDTPVNFSDFGTRLVEDGDGDEVGAGSIIAINYQAFTGVDGSQLYSTYDNGATETIQVSEAQIDPTLYAVLSKAHVGAKVLFAVPDQGDGSGATLMALHIESVTQVLDRAEGTAVAPVAGLPVVTLADSGQPSVSWDGATKPEALVSQDLITGAGAAVAEGQSVTVHYSGWVWGSDKVFDSSWDRGTSATFTLATGQLIDGWVQGLVGKTVGSQVLLVIPSDLAYKDQDQKDSAGNVTIPANSTLVFVVDILAAN